MVPQIEYLCPARGSNLSGIQRLLRFRFKQNPESVYTQSRPQWKSDKIQDSQNYGQNPGPGFPFQKSPTGDKVGQAVNHTDQKDKQADYAGGQKSRFITGHQTAATHQDGQFVSLVNIADSSTGKLLVLRQAETLVEAIAIEVDDIVQKQVDAIVAKVQDTLDKIERE